mmetsp:Transcript_25012/g.32653  ORF Transcript_25012/g.32653 Transcript_25012/m.32653 type:complete len:85 (-) Transcript_25012:53-307(-)
MNGKPILSSIDHSREHFTLELNEDALNKELEAFDLSLGESAIVDAGNGLFAKRDFEESKIIVPRYWGHLAVGKVAPSSDKFIEG